MTLSGLATDRGWFVRHPLAVAWDLIGATLSVGENELVSGRIVEAEAYAGLNDLAAHSGRLRAAREILFGPQARLYMYRSYGIHTMLNVVAHEDGMAGGILIRACEPVGGEPTIATRRSTDRANWLRGPGALCQGFGLQLDDNRLDLATTDRVRLEVEAPHASLAVSPRIGISRSTTVPWRVFDPNSPFVSRSRRGTVVERATLGDLCFSERDIIP